MVDSYRTKWLAIIEHPDTEIFFKMNTYLAFRRENGGMESVFQARQVRRSPKRRWFSSKRSTSNGWHSSTKSFPEPPSLWEDGWKLLAWSLMETISGVLNVYVTIRSQVRWAIQIGSTAELSKLIGVCDTSRHFYVIYWPPWGRIWGKGRAYPLVW